MADTNETDGGESKVTILAGTANDRYVASDLVDDSDILHESKLTIKNLEEADKNIKYRLIINNTVGSNTYSFEVVLHEVKNTATKPTLALPSTKEEEGVSKVTVSIVAIVCIILFIVAVGLLCRLCHKRGAEITPLIQSST